MSSLVEVQIFLIWKVLYGHLYFQNENSEMVFTELQTISWIQII